MDKPRAYEIHLEGYLTDRWSGWFEGLVIQPVSQNETSLKGTFVDQAALYGILNKIHALNLVLISVCRVQDKEIEK